MFDKHFTESKHAFGMRALGLPNTRHFAGITSIRDAMACTFMHRSETIR
jgi:splicing factor 3A subunit 3